MTYYAYAGDFSNRFTVAAFVSREARQTWMDRQHAGQLVKTITRREARRELAGKMDDLDLRQSFGCYVGSRDPHKDADRRREAEYHSVPGVCDPAIRL